MRDAPAARQTPTRGLISFSTRDKVFVTWDDQSQTAEPDCPEERQQQPGAPAEPANPRHRPSRTHACHRPIAIVRTYTKCLSSCVNFRLRKYYRSRIEANTETSQVNQKVQLWRPDVVD